MDFWRILRSSLRWSFHLFASLNLPWLTLGVLTTSSSHFQSQIDVIDVSFTFCPWVQPKMAPHNLPIPKRTFLPWQTQHVKVPTLEEQLVPRAYLLLPNMGLSRKFTKLDQGSSPLHLMLDSHLQDKRSRSILLEVPQGRIKYIYYQSGDLFLPAQHLTNFEAKKLGYRKTSAVLLHCCSWFDIFAMVHPKKIPCGLASLVSFK